MREFEAGSERYRLDEFLAREVVDVSVTRLRRMIADGDVVVNGLRSLKGARLQAGDTITILSANIEATAATPEPIPLEILLEDDDIIAVNKPTGLLTHPSHSHKSGTLTNGLAYHFLATTGRAIRAGLVHRLDRDTSGIILVAKTLRAHRILAKAFRERRVTKTYTALLTGRVNTDSADIDAPIGSDPDTWPHWRILPEGRPALTRYKVLRRFPAHTLVEFVPQTGRTHQLRIHSLHLGNPIVGDAIYAPQRDQLVDQCGLTHQLLHAARMSFIHPGDGREMVIEAPLPGLWAEILKRL